MQPIASHSSIGCVCVALLYLLLSTPPSTTLTWVTCGEDGTVNCSAIDVNTTAGGNALPPSINVIANCTYINCPPLALNKQNVSFVNVSFVNSVNPEMKETGGGAIVAISSTVSLVNCSFVNCRSAGTGGAIALQTSTLFGQDLMFESNYAARSGGDIYLSQNTTFQCNRCFFRNSRSDDSGAAIYATRYVDLTWIGGSCNSTSAKVWGGCVQIQENGVASISDISVDNATAYTGGAFVIISTSTATMKNVSVVRTSSSNQAGCLYLNNYSILRMTNSTFDGCTAGETGGMAVIQSNSELHFATSIAMNSVALQSGGTMQVLQNSIVNISASTIRNGTSGQGGGLYLVGPQSKAFCDFNSEILCCKAKTNGGAFMQLATTNVTIGYCIISDNSADNNGGAFMLNGESTLTITAKGRVSKNTAGRSGGGISLAGLSTLVFVDGSMQNNVAKTCGGAIHTADDSPTVNLTSNQVYISDNEAPLGSFFCMQGMNATTLYTGGTTLRTPVLGTLWTEQALAALAIMNSGALKILPNVKPSSKPVTLATYPRSIQNITVNVKQTLPPLTVGAQDAFGYPVTASPLTPVIVRIVEVSGYNATILGESAMPIFDLENSGRRTFSGLQLIASPGTYILEIQAIPGTTSHIDQYPWPRITVYVSECEPKTEYFLAETGSCIPIRPTGSAIRVFFGILATIILILSTCVTIGLHYYRKVALVKANSATFLCICCIGSCLGMLALIIQMIQEPWVCVVKPWFDQFAFVFVFGAIMLKTYRIQRIFNSLNADMNAVKKLKDTNLAKYFAIPCVISLVYLIIWTILKPAYPNIIIVYNSFVTVDRCSGSSFSIAIISVRFLIQLFAVWLAYSIRMVHAAFNESRFIGFATYNWMIFGALLHVLVLVLINDPVVAYALEGVTIIVPHLITVMLLGGIKVYYCMFKPEAANQGNSNGNNSTNSAQPVNFHLRPPRAVGPGRVLTPKPHPRALPLSIAPVELTEGGGF